MLVTDTWALARPICTEYFQINFSTWFMYLTALEIRMGFFLLPSSTILHSMAIQTLAETLLGMWLTCTLLWCHIIDLFISSMYHVCAYTRLQWTRCYVWNGQYVYVEHCNGTRLFTTYVAKTLWGNGKKRKMKVERIISSDEWSHFSNLRNYFYFIRSTKAWILYRTQHKYDFLFNPINQWMQLCFPEFLI